MPNGASSDARSVGCLFIEAVDMEFGGSSLFAGREELYCTYCCERICIGDAVFTFGYMSVARSMFIVV